MNILLHIFFKLHFLAALFSAAVLTFSISLGMQSSFFLVNDLNASRLKLMGVLCNLAGTVIVLQAFIELRLKVFCNALQMHKTAMVVKITKNTCVPHYVE